MDEMIEQVRFLYNIQIKCIKISNRIIYPKSNFLQLVELNSIIIYFEHNLS